jgi:hypothetical protein
MRGTVTVFCTVAYVIDFIVCVTAYVVTFDVHLRQMQIFCTWGKLK